MPPLQPYVRSHAGQVKLGGDCALATLGARQGGAERHGSDFTPSVNAFGRSNDL